MTQRALKSIRIETRSPSMNYSFMPRIVRLIVALTGTKDYRTGVGVLVSRLLRLWRINRRPFLVKYLKVSYLHTINSIAGSKYTPHREPIVSLDSKGLPRIIPLSIRREIWKSPMDRDWEVVQIVLSIFNLYRVIQLPGKLKLETIVDPFNGIAQELDMALVQQGLDYLTGGSHKQMRLRWEFFHSSNAGPNAKVSTIGIWPDLVAWFSQPRQFWLAAWIMIKRFRNRYYFLQFFVWNLISILVCMPIWYKRGRYPYKMGKLSEKLEAAGKIRVFAITDWWTQNLLFPIHRYLFNFLENLPMDGTFDQSAILVRSQEIASRRRTCWSFDLSAATDRLPLKFQAQVLSLISRDPALAKAWATLLSDRDWEHPTGPKRYAVGQPMGALSSWAIIAVTHHVIVQMAAINAGMHTRFEDYSILGDDVVIFDGPVADQYLILMKTLGVEVNLAKSVVSADGWFEFAKRFIHADIDISPLGAKALVLSASSPNWASVSLIDAGQKGLIDRDDAIARVEGIVDGRFARRTQINSLYAGLFGPGGIFINGEVSLTAFADRDSTLRHSIPSVVEKVRVQTLLGMVEEELSSFYIRVTQNQGIDNPIDFWELGITKKYPYLKNILTWIHPVSWWWSFKIQILREEIFDFRHWRDLQMGPVMDAYDDHLGLRSQYRALIQVDMSKYDLSFGKNQTERVSELLNKFGERELQAQDAFRLIQSKWISPTYRI